jgi:hypothetical protein
MSIAERVTARHVYQTWFYAPHFTGRRCAERLRALGFVWDGARWHWPTRERFMQGIRT